MSIRAKLVAAILVLLVVVIGSKTGYDIYSARVSAFRAFEDSATGTTRALAKGLANALYFSDLRETRELLRVALYNPRIVSAYVLDLDGYVVSDGSKENLRFDEVLDEPFVPEILEAEDWLSVQGENLLKMGGPIRLADGTELAHLYVTFALSDLQSALTAELRLAAIMALMLLVAGAAMAWLLSSWITRPLVEITEVARKVGAGNLDVRVPATRPDELGELARTINEMATSLDSVIAERMELQAKFLQAQKMEALGRLAGGVAHDFNNILASVLGYSSILVEDLPKGSEHRSYAESIVRASERASQLVSQMLAFGRASEGQRRAVDTAEVVAETAQMLRASLPASIGFEVEIVDDEVWVEADPTQLGQVLLNLCVNARDALADDIGTIAVEVRSEEVDEDSHPRLVRRGPEAEPPALETAVDEPNGSRLWTRALDPGQHVRLSVCDSGEGIDPATIDSILEPFFTTKKGPKKGTGLGLAVVAGLVRSHGGALEIASRHGEGTTVSVYLPRIERPSTAELEAKELEVAAKSQQILVVEDERDVAASLKLLLERFGHETTAVCSADEAFRLLTREPRRFTLVISDQAMPEMTGMQLLSRLRSGGVQVPFILCTGYSRTVDEQSARRAGAAALLYKPVGKEDLLAAIELATSSERRHGDPRATSRLL